MTHRIYRFKIKMHDGGEADFNVKVDEDDYVVDSSFPILVDNTEVLDRIFKTPKDKLENTVLNTKEVMTVEEFESKKVRAGKITQATHIDGVSYRVGENGEKIIDKVDDKVTQMMPFFDLKKPCFFKGCESLRASYIKDVRKAGGTENCPACKRGALMRKYMKKLQNLEEFKIEKSPKAVVRKA